MNNNQAKGHTLNKFSSHRFSLACMLLVPVLASTMPVIADPEDPGISKYADPNWKIRSLLDFLDTMEDALAGTIGDGSCGKLESGEPAQVQGEPDMQATSSLRLLEADTTLWTGLADITAHQADGTVDLVIELENEAYSRRWTLTQTMRLESDILYVSGTLDVIDIFTGIATWTGGWTYSAADGAQPDPASDLGFHDEVANMFACASGGTAGGAIPAALTLGDILTFVGNVTTLAINYLLDLLIPYTPPTACTGPSIDDGPDGTCEMVNISCRDNLSTML